MFPNHWNVFLSALLWNQFSDIFIYTCLNSYKIKWLSRVCVCDSLSIHDFVYIPVCVLSDWCNADIKNHLKCLLNNSCPYPPETCSQTSCGNIFSFLCKYTTKLFSLLSWNGSKPWRNFPCSHTYIFLSFWPTTSIRLSWEHSVRLLLMLWSRTSTAWNLSLAVVLQTSGVMTQEHCSCDDGDNTAEWCIWTARLVTVAWEHMSMKFSSETIQDLEIEEFVFQIDSWLL